MKLRMTIIRYGVAKQRKDVKNFEEMNYDLEVLVHSTEVRTMVAGLDGPFRYHVSKDPDHSSRTASRTSLRTAEMIRLYAPAHVRYANFQQQTA